MSHFSFLFPAMALAALLGGPVTAQATRDMLVPVKVRTQVLISPTAPELEQSVFDHRDDDEVLRREINKRGAMMGSLPSVVMKQDEPTTLQVMRSKDGGPVWDGKAPLPMFAGWILHLAPKPAGKKIDLRVQPAYGFVPGEHPVPIEEPSKAPDWDRVVSKSVDVSAKLSSGQTVVIPLGEVESGVHVTCFVQATAVNPFGQPASDFSLRIPAPVHVPGILKAHATLIDTEDTDFVLWDESAMPTFSLLGILSPDQLAVILKEKSSEFKKLDSVQFPTGRPQQAWKELKDLQITGALNKEKTVIDLGFSLKRGGRAAFKTGISLYPEMVILLSLPSDKADTKRILAVSCEIIK